MKNEFLGSIHFNKNKDLLVSSSSLTFEKWTGRVACISQPNVSLYVSSLNNSASKSLRLLRANKSDEEKDPNMTMIRYMTGITRVKWSLNNEHFLAASELGHIELFKATKTTNMPINDDDGDDHHDDDNDDDATSKSDKKKSEYVFESLMYAKEHESLIECLETRLDGPLVLTGSHDTKIKVWDLNEQMSTRTLNAHDDVVCSLSLHPNDNNSFISCSIDGQALFWDLRKSKPAFRISHHFEGFPSSSSWGGKASPNLIALGSETGQLGVYDVRILNNNKPYSLIRPHTRIVRRVEFNPELNELATASEDCRTCAFKIVEPSVLTDASVAQMYEFKHTDYVTDLLWSSATEYLTCSWDGTLRQHQVIGTKMNGHSEKV